VRARPGTTQPPTTQPPTRDERGFALVIVLAGITVMMIMMGAAVPTWKYVMHAFAFVCTRVEARHGAT